MYTCNCCEQSDQCLAVPHASVPDIRWVDWAALRLAGFKACVFDKDNTLSEPFALKVHPDLVVSCQCSSLSNDGMQALTTVACNTTVYT